MIAIGDWTLSLDDPRPWGAAAAIALFLFFVRAVMRALRAVEPLSAHLADLDGAVRALNDGQNQLYGGLTHVADAQAAAQSRMVETMESRLSDVTRAMGDNLTQSSVRTARSLGDLQQRLAAIDKAQSNIEKLSGDVLGLQDILSNKQTRGAFGEIQLREIVSRALPPDAVRFQATLSNGARVDCLVDAPHPPGPIAIDAKFPLEAYEALVAANNDAERKAARRAMRAAIRAHMRAISEKYVIEGETAEGALMFLPSEAVYAELHANFTSLVREGFDLRVWIVSPSTCMATLHTLRAVLKDVRMRAEAQAIRRELALLYKDVERLTGRVGNLDRHFSQAQKDLEEIRISADRSRSRARKLEAIDFSDGEIDREPVEDGPRIVSVAPDAK